MSMCKQIVGSLGGRIEVKSKQGRGTTVRVIVDLTCSLESGVSGGRNGSLPFTTLDRHDKCINFFGTDQQNQSCTTPKTISTLEYACKDYFGLDFNQTLTPGVADVYLTTQSCISEMAASRTTDQAGDVESFVPLHSPVIVLCDSASTAQAFQEKQDCHELSDQLVEFVSQP